MHMHNVVNIEQSLLNNLRQLTLDKQQEVLDFAEFLCKKNAVKLTDSKLSLREIAALPLAQRHQLLISYISETAQDFIDDRELTEFACLDGED